MRADRERAARRNDVLAAIGERSMQPAPKLRMVTGTTGDRSRPKRRGSLLAMAVCVMAAADSGCASQGTEAYRGSEDGGTLEGGNQNGGSEGGSSSPAGVGLTVFADPCSAGTTTVDWAPQRRISRVEYDNMIRDLLGDTSHPSVVFQIPAEAQLGYGINLPLVNTYAPADATALTQYLLAAESLAESAVGDTSRMNNVILAGIASCSAAHDDTCAKDFIATWVNRAYRGQLDATESASLFSMYQTVKGQTDWTTGIQAVITTVLVSPRFLYVLEFGNGSPSGDVVPLSSYEVAARLAFFLWRSVPDAKVMADAATGTLATPAGIRDEAQYMLTATNPVTGTLYAEDALDDFTNQWLQLTGVQAKDGQFKAYSANLNLGASMYDEARIDFSQLVLAANGSLIDLLTSTSSYINSDLQTYYGAGAGSGPSVTVNDSALTNQKFTQTTLANRPGILTNGGVMATQAHSTLPSLVLRGKLVRENLLCDPIGMPPPNVPNPVSSPPDAGTTTRDLLLAHMQKGTICPYCHQEMDLIGAAFGNFDAAGQYQSTDANGFSGGSFPPIDASGQFMPVNSPPDPAPLSSSFQNVTDFASQLAHSTQGQQCFALQELRYALGRLEMPADACSAQQAFQAFSASTLNIQELLLAIVQTDVMRYRSAYTPGKSCQ
jgi:hypothetical protein